MPAHGNWTTDFHPITRQWFEERVGVPTDPQRLGWREMASGQDTLIAAPTGSGKTLAAMLICLDRLLRMGLEGRLADETDVVYVSPLRALSNDIRRNLEIPLAELRQRAHSQGLASPEIRVFVRTSDTPAHVRSAMVRRPPHIVVTTPESLYLLLTSVRGREMLRTVSTVIVDEIHVLARDKRGVHLALSLERLERLATVRPLRIGLSATQRPIDEIARFLVGTAAGPPRFVSVGAPSPSEPAQHCGGWHAPSQRGASGGRGVATVPPRPYSPALGDRGGGERAGCRIIDAGHLRDLDLAIELPQGELSAVCSGEAWKAIHLRLADLIRGHRSTLVFVNTRRMAERVGHQLTQLLGPGTVACHHGSLSKEIRLEAEDRLQRGELKAIVATASLELGIDVGYVDLVCQLGSPRAIATFLQRVGRAGHRLGLVPKGRLFSLTRDDLVEGLALLRAVRQGQLDKIEIPRAPLDILAQQMIAMVACEEWAEDDLYELVRRAWPYRDLDRQEFDAVVAMLTEVASRRQRPATTLHRDVIGRRLRARRGNRLAALTSGGAIPDNADYRVLLGDDRTFIGTVNEDFAIESLPGDIFLLGNSSWRIRQVRSKAGELRVDDAAGQPPTIPFWLGEAPGRTFELSGEVGSLRAEIARRVPEVPAQASALSPEDSRGVAPPGESDVPLASQAASGSAWPLARQAASGAPGEADLAQAIGWLMEACGADRNAALQAARYVAIQKAAHGIVPTQQQVVFERFFDEAGGMQLVIHAPFGARINRAWGLALRKRFCRTFDFELQASASDNGIVLSLGPQHSFPIEQVFTMLRSGTAQKVLEQAILAAPMFQVRWRWNATRALAVLRHRGGQKVPAPLLRMRADDFLTAVFPSVTACRENVPGDIPIPDHPLVRQTLLDCYQEAMDVDGWLELLAQAESGAIECLAREGREPSPFAYELLNANPYAFLDPAPLEERRARAVATRQTLDASELRDLCQLDPEAIAQVCAEAWPLVRNADELQEALVLVAAMPELEAAAWEPFFAELLAAGRATRVRCAGPRRPVVLWAAAECWPLVRAAIPGATADPPPSLPPDLGRQHDPSEAAARVVQGRLEIIGPTTAAEIADSLGIPAAEVQASLVKLETQGVVFRGKFRPAAVHAAQTDPDEWCDRRLLARIHRLTIEGLRKRIQPVPVRDFVRFLLDWHGIADSSEDEETSLGPLFPGGKRGTAEAERLRAAIRILEGFEAPAGAWEPFLLAARVPGYDPAMLDRCTLGGEVVWGRLSVGTGALTGTGGLHRGVPIALAFREDLAWLRTERGSGAPTPTRAHVASTLQGLSDRGALFFDELLALTGLLPSQLEESLGQLCAMGLARADGFSAVRLAIVRRRGQGRRRRRPQPWAGSACGRWSRLPVPGPQSEQVGQEWARLLLRRYGIVFRDLVAGESLAPAWPELVRALRRMEARGEIQGGRFVADVAGEQFAHPDAVARLRAVRDRDHAGRLVILSAADPLNLSGILFPGPRIPALLANRIVLAGGQLVASCRARQLHLLEPLDPGQTRALARQLGLSLDRIAV